MSGKGGKQVNKGLYKRGSKARAERDAIWRDAWIKKDWTEARKKKNNEDDLRLEESPYDQKEVAEVLRKYRKEFPEWKPEDGQSLHDFAMDLAWQGDPRGAKFRSDLFRILKGDETGPTLMDKFIYDDAPAVGLGDKEESE